MDDTDRSFLEELLPWSPTCRKTSGSKFTTSHASGLSLSRYLLWSVYDVFYEREILKKESQLNDELQKLGGEWKGTNSDVYMVIREFNMTKGNVGKSTKSNLYVC